MISLLKSKSDFFNSRGICISGTKLTVFHWQRGELGSSYMFDKDETGVQNFKRYLAETPNTPMYVLVDVIEEEFRMETIPHVFGADRKSLIERKKSRLFRDASYFYSQGQGRDTEGRRDDFILLTALTKDDLIKPWLELLDEHKVPVKGIISVPLLLQSYIKTIPDLSDNALIVTMESISGLRQTFFHEKQLKISRLSKLPRFGTDPYAPIIKSEVQKIQRYLTSLRLISVEKPLDVYIIADSDLLDHIQTSNLELTMVYLHMLDINKLSKTDVSQTKHATPFSDSLLMQFLLETQPVNCYAASSDMRYAKMRNIKYSMNILSVLFLIFSFLYSGLNFVNGMTYKQESESSKEKTAFYQSRYDLAKERLPKTPVDAAQLKVAVDAVKILNEYKSTPFEMFSVISTGLERFPVIKLDDMDWTFSIDPNLDTVAASTPSSNTTDLNSDDERQIKYYQISNINAHIESFNGNYREAIATVNQFAETIREIKDVISVSIESFPLDISSTASLQGDVGSVGKEALFSIRTVVGVYK